MFQITSTIEKRLLELAALVAIFLLMCGETWAQGTAITYQGRLSDAGNLANNNYDMRFKLFDTQTVGTGTQQGSILTVSPVQVTNGVFTVQLDFGGGVFTGADRFLEIAVKLTSGGSFTTLEPRQPITSTAYTIRSLNATTADGLSAACTNCVTSSHILSVNASSIVSGTLSTARGGTGLDGSTAGNGKLLIGNGSGFSLANLTPGTGIGITNSAGGITIAAMGGITSLNGLAVGTQTFATGTSGTDFNISSSGTVHTFNIPDASATGRGLVTTGLQTLAGSKLFTSKVGIGTTTTPTAALHITNLGSTPDRTDIALDTTTADFRRRGLSFMTNGVLRWALDTDNVPEGGGNTGSVFELKTYDDSGTLLRNVFEARRNDGAVVWLSSLNPANETALMSIGDSDVVTFNKLTVRGSVGTVLRLQADTASTNTRQTVVNTIASTSGLMADGFGPQFAMQAVDSGGTPNTLGLIGAQRTGANNSGALVFHTANAGTVAERMRISPSGQVGIGTANPADALDVSGTIRMSTLGAAGATSLCYNASNQISSCSSSLRYKSGVLPLTTGLDLITRLRPVTFNWKATNERDLGLIAEEVAQVEPLLVTRNEKGEIEGVKYNQLSVLLINAIKEQQQQIKEHEGQAKLQQEQIDEYRNRVSQQDERRERQQREIEDIKLLVCSSQPNAAACKGKR